MTVDLRHHHDILRDAFPGTSFYDFLEEHYDLRTDADGAVCKRCGMEVTGVTKHARNCHGVDVPDVPAAPEVRRNGPSSDDWGRPLHLRTFRLRVTEAA